MPFDVDSIPPEARARYARIGRAFGHDEVADQVRQTLAALREFGPLLKDYGFDPALHGVELSDAAAAHLAAIDARVSAKGTRKITNAALLRQTFAGKSTRMRMRAILNTARVACELDDDAEPLAVIDAALASTSSAGADPKLLRTQLVTLAETFENPLVAAKIPNAPELATTLRAQAASIEAAYATSGGGSGTPAETATVDVIEGFLIVLVRLARHAARAAARDLGRPEVAKRFELDELYRTARKSKPEGEPAAQ